MSRGFAGGLAEGLNQGMQMYALHKNIESRDKADQRADAADLRDQETHAAKQKEIADVRNMTEGWAKALGWNPQQAGGSPMRPDAPGMGAPAQPADTPSAIGLGGPAPMGGTPSAAGLQPSAPAAAQPQQAPVSAGEFIQKQVWSGDAFSNPETLNKMAAIAFANNQGGMGIQFLNQVHTATKQGWGKALASLVSGDGKSAAATLKANGMDVRGEMTPVEGKEHTWKVNIGGKDQELSAKDLFMSANPEEAYKMHLQGKELQRKADMDQKTHELNERKVANDELETRFKGRETQAKIGMYGEKGALYRAQAKNAAEKPAAGLKSTASSAKDIATAHSRRDNQFKDAATITDQDGEERVNPDLRRKYENVASTLESMIEDERGEKLDSHTMHIVTDEVKKMDLAKWGPEEVKAGLRKALPRFGLDGTEEPKEEKKDPSALGGKPVETKAPAAAALKKESAAVDREADKVAETYSGTKYHDQMLSVQRAMRSPNLSAEQRANLAMRASKIAADYEKEYGKRK